MRGVMVGRFRGPRRAGKYMVLLAPILPVLLGMTGLTIDAGILLAIRRQAQNAADAAALAAAHDLFLGKSSAIAEASAREAVKTDNLLPNSIVDVDIPPVSGPYRENDQYAEVTVTLPMRTALIQFVGVDRNQTVTARAVAGFEAIPADQQYLITLLNRNATPGLRLQGIPFDVDGRIAVNSEGGGRDENGASVNLGKTGNSVQTSAAGRIIAPEVRAVGGADNPSRIQDRSGNGSLRARSLPVADPLLNLPTPTVSNGVINAHPTPVATAGNPSITSTTSPVDNRTQILTVDANASESVALSPGIYSSIQIRGSGSVTFQPGVYVLTGGDTSSGSLNIFTTGSVVGRGVLFYNTGSDYDPVSGGPDAADGNSFGGPLNALSPSRINIRSSSLELTGLDDSSSPFNGMLFYQRRTLNASIQIDSRSEQTQLAGTVYARSGEYQISGRANFRLQTIAGSMFVRRSDLFNDTSVFSALNAHEIKQVALVE